VPYRISDSPIEEGSQIYTDGGNAQPNIEDDNLSLGHALPMISPYGLG